MRQERAMRTFWLVLALSLLAAWSATAKTPLPTFGDKATYPEVRARLITEGYTPLPNRGRNIGSCEDHPEFCRRFPELAGCTDNAGDDCSYLWKSPDGDFFVIWADSCCDQWVQAPKAINTDEAEAILSPPTHDLPHISRKLRYPAVRKRLLALGYEPQVVSRRPDWACAYTSKSMCKRYPELIDCGNALCDFVYRRPGDHRLVTVRTRNEGDGFYEIYLARPEAYSGVTIRRPKARR